MVDPLHVGRFGIGSGHPCFIIAEIGSNHDGDLDRAIKLIEEAALAGASAVKFQTFKASEHYSKFTPEFNYLGGESTFELIRSLEIDRSWHQELQLCAKDNGVEFFSSPCDFSAVDELAALDIPAFKVASFDLTDLEIIAHMARTGKVIILSTGMADWKEIQRAVKTCRENDNNQIVLLQCTSLYPAPANLSNLNSMRSMTDEFGVLSGYSDHTEGIHVAVAAVALGAQVIEKHFTLDRSLPGPDHSFATEPNQFKEMVSNIREVEISLGDGKKDGPREAEIEMFQKGRRSLHAKVSISKGIKITENMLITKRPGLGIAPYMKDKLIGKTVKVDIAADQWITWEMV